MKTEKKNINKFIKEYYCDILNTKMVYENVKNNNNDIEISENEFNIGN